MIDETDFIDLDDLSDDCDRYTFRQKLSAETRRALEYWYQAEDGHRMQKMMKKRLDFFYDIG